MKIGEFFFELGVDADSKTLKDFIGGFGDLHLTTLANITSLAAMAHEIFQLGVEATNAAVGFQMFRNQTGLSSQELQKWQIVAMQANVSTEAVASSVSNLQKNLAEVRLGRGNISPFQMLGISPRGNAFDVLEQFRSKINKYDAATTTNLAAQMGITPEMINILKLSNQEFTKLSKTVRGMTTEQEAQFLKTKQSLSSLGVQFKYLGFDIAYHFLDAFDRIGTSVKELQLYWPGLIAAVGALAIAFAPVTTAVIGLLLLLDDLAVYAKGGNSVFGMLEKKFIGPGANKAGNFLNDHLPAWANEMLTTVGSGLAGSPVAGNSKTTINNNVSVQGTGSPDDIAVAVARRLASTNAAAQSQINDQGH